MAPDVVVVVVVAGAGEIQVENGGRFQEKKVEYLKGKGGSDVCKGVVVVVVLYAKEEVVFSLLQ